MTRDTQQDTGAISGLRRHALLRWLFGLNAGLGVLLALVLVIMINFISFRHYGRWDWTATRYYRLSDKSIRLLESLTNTVHIFSFIQPGQDAYDDTRNLLREYQQYSDAIVVEWVDPDRDLARTEELAARFDVSKANVVVFDSGVKTHYVTADDIVEYDYSPMRMGQSPERTAFGGEQVFSSAIHSVVEDRNPIVYFLGGHGEGDIRNTDQRNGFSRIAREIDRDNIQVKRLVFGEQKTVPEDCDTLVILGPVTEISPVELDLIGDYLDSNGRVMLLSDSYTETGLEQLLHTWGIKLGKDVVVDSSRTLSGRELFITEYEPHPITDKLRDITSIFYLPRSVQPVTDEATPGDPADKPHVVPLASSSELGWAESDLESSVMKYAPAEDQPGPVPVAVAMEKGPVPGIDVHIRPTRMVVFGDSDFVSNGAMTGGDLDFFMSALNWLLEREALMAISAKPVHTSRLIISSTQLRSLFWVVVVLMPGIFVLMGILVWFRRRTS